MRWFLVAALALIGCANTHTIPTQAMARAAIELHVAEQHGARYSAEGAALCKRAEVALEQARRRAFRGQPEAALAVAEDGYAYARQARELTRGTPAAAAREQHVAARALGGGTPTIASTAPAVR
jgi:hypothetical protein